MTQSWLEQIQSLEALGRIDESAQTIQLETLSDGRVRAEHPASRAFVRERMRAVEVLPTGPSWSVLRCSSPKAVALARGQSGPRRVLAAGSLEDGWSFVDLVGFVASGHKSGVLTLADWSDSGETVRRSIYFFQGQTLWLTSTEPSERLGPFLNQLGLLSMDQLQVALGEGPDRLLSACIERRYLSLGKLPELAQQFVLERLESVLSQEQGVWSFGLVDERRLAECQHPMPTQALLVEALRRLDELRVFKHRLGPPSSRFRRSAEPMESLQAESIDDTVRQQCQSILRLINHPSTVFDVMRLAGLGSFETHRALYHLHRAKLVEVEALPNRPKRTSVDLEEVVHVHTLALNEVLADMEQAGHMEDLLEVFRQFDHEESFRWPGLPLDPQHRVDSDSLLTRLHDEASTARTQSEQMSELLFTALLRASECLGRRKGDDLARRVRLIHRMLEGSEDG